MADIFLSYSRADRPTAQVIAEALQAEGFSVWWDKVLRAGQTYDEVTESMLRDSEVVVVLWSQTSVKSKWVRAEATLGQRGCELVPAMIEEADRPIMFELTQTADLIGWDGDRNDARWGDFVTDIKRSLDKHQAAAQAPAPASPGAPTAPTASKDDATIETVFWTSIKDGDDPADFEAYVKRYPDGHYVDLARNRLAALSASAATVAAAAAAAVPVAAPAPPVPPVEKPAAAAPPKPAAPAQQKKKSSPLPMLLVGLAVVAGGGWFGAQYLGLLPSGETDTPGVEDEPVETVMAAACERCPEMVAIAGGSFTMGSPDDEPNRSGIEGPQREVTLQPFLMSKTEVTWDQWAACVEDGACREAQGSGSGSFPVTGVSYPDAVAYTRWLSSKAGTEYRLPSEAQWEYAARAGTETAYWWGANYPGPGINDLAVADTVELPENPFGLVGTLGNVREWVADCYRNSYEDAPSDGRAVGSGNCQQPVVRGGSFRDGAAEHRAANRARYGRTIRDRSLGFRVVSRAPDS